MSQAETRRPLIERLARRAIGRCVKCNIPFKPDLDEDLVCDTCVLLQEQDNVQMSRIREYLERTFQGYDTLDDRSKEVICRALKKNLENSNAP
jgi:hypothetical protein